MRTIETMTVVTHGHTVTVPVPDGVPAGRCRVVLTLDPAGTPSAGADRPFPFDWHMIDIGPWPEGYTVSREQMYGDDGR